MGLSCRFGCGCGLDSVNHFVECPALVQAVRSLAGALRFPLPVATEGRLHIKEMLLLRPQVSLEADVFYAVILDAAIHAHSRARCGDLCHDASSLAAALMARYKNCRALSPKLAESVGSFATCRRLLVCDC